MHDIMLNGWWWWWWWWCDDVLACWWGPHRDHNKREPPEEHPGHHASDPEGRRGPDGSGGLCGLSGQAHHGLRPPRRGAGAGQPDRGPTSCPLPVHPAGSGERHGLPRSGSIHLHADGQSGRLTTVNSSVVVLLFHIFWRYIQTYNKIMSG